MAGKKPYLIVNSILAGMIGLVFIYSGLFSAGKDKHPIPSFYEKITGQPSPSSGMSRAFSKIIRGDLEAAKDFNPDSPMIFAFFLIQGIQRILVSFLLLKFRSNTASSSHRSRLQKKHLLIADVFLSIVFFLFCFLGQIRAMFELLTS